MLQDPIIEEIHRIREEYARKFDFNIDAICKDLQAKQTENEHRLVSFPGRPSANPRNIDAMTQSHRSGVSSNRE